MDEQKPKSSWDDLIKEIGAAPPPDALERKRPAIETTFEAPPEARAEAIKPKPGDWNALASELGLKVKEEPAAKPAAPAPHAGPSSNALEASFAEIEPLESDFEDVVEDEIADIDFEDDEDEGEDEDDEFPRAKPPAADPSTLAGEAARNAFEALFEAGSFAAMPPLKKPEQPETPRKPGGPQWRELDEPRAAEREEIDEEITFEEVDEFEAEVGEGKRASEEERDRSRRRRRRRRGRGRDGDRPDRGQRSAEHADKADDELEGSVSDEALDDEAEEVEGEAAEGDELGEKPVRRRRRRRRRGKGEAGDERSDRAAANGETADEDDASEHAAGEDGDDGDDSPRESHKNIPTWSDAISVMVETNLQSRKTSPSRPSGPRERGRGGRGRGRGGNGGGRRGKA